jgi:hypothetical protein
VGTISGVRARPAGLVSAEALPAMAPTVRKGQSSSAPESVIKTRIVAITIWKTRPTADDRAARETVGDLPRGQGENQERQELREPDEAEVERILVDQVDLHADRDDEHLEREPARERRRPEERERAHAQSGGQALPHERER